MYCLRCKKKMIRVIHKGILVDMCPNSNCESIWLDKGELNLILRNVQLSMDKIWEQDRKESWRDKIIGFFHPSMCPSPECQGRLHKDFIEGVEIERCEKCEGMFFDKGEIDKIVNLKNKKNVLYRLFEFLGLN